MAAQAGPTKRGLRPRGGPITRSVRLRREHPPGDATVHQTRAYSGRVAALREIAESGNHFVWTRDNGRPFDAAPRGRTPRMLASGAEAGRGPPVRRLRVSAENWLDPLCGPWTR